ncbi:hypothetical protein U0070_006659, partial [Myodes glareolus]
MPFFHVTHRQIYKNVQEVLDYIGHTVEKHWATLEPKNPRDFIDTYLICKEMRKDLKICRFTPDWIASQSHQRHFVPKNTEVYPILSSALHDPRYFEQPDTFNPDHFLDASGTLKKNEAFMPFSIEHLEAQSSARIQELAQEPDAGQDVDTLEMVAGDQKLNVILGYKCNNNVCTNKPQPSYPYAWQLRENCGDFFTVHLGPRPVIMLCGTEAIREALVDQTKAFSGRGTNAMLEPIVQRYGVFFSSGECWKTLQQFSLATMKSSGMVNHSVEEQIQEETRCVVEELQKLQEKYGDVFTVHLGPRPVVMLCGTEAIREALVDQAEAFSGWRTVAVFEPIVQRYGEIRDRVKWQICGLCPWQMLEGPSTILSGHHEGLRNGQAQCGGADSGIGPICGGGAAETPGGPPLDLAFVFQCITANIICSLFFGECFDFKECQFLQIYKNVQEVLDYIGHTVEKHWVTLEPKNPRDFIDTYLICKEMRSKDLQIYSRLDCLTKSPKTLCSEGTVLQVKSANTEVYPILSSALHDPRYFEQPDTFNPDHFLDASGTLKKNEAFMPFSI